MKREDYYFENGGYPIQVVWFGSGLYAPRQQGSVTWYYQVDNDDDAYRSGLGTPGYYEKPEGFNGNDEFVDEWIGE